LVCLDAILHKDYRVTAINIQSGWDLCLPVGRKGSIPTGHLEQWVSLRTGIYLPYLMQQHYRDAEKGTEHWKTDNKFSIVLFFNN